MVHIVQNILNIFSCIPSEMKCKEDLNLYQYSFSFMKGKNALTNEAPVLSKMRDALTIRLLEDGMEDDICYQSSRDDWACFVVGYNDIDIGVQITCTIEIIKSQEERVISVYDINVFSQMLLNLSLLDFFSCISKRLIECLHFEVMQQDFQSWHSVSISFGREGETYQLSNPNILSDRKNKREQMCKLCFAEFPPEWNLIPEDLMVEHYDSNNLLQKAFRKACAFLSFAYITNWIKIDDQKIDYKLEGFKTYSNVIDVKSMLALDITEVIAAYKMYRWIYTDGGQQDKINLARNIISLTFNETDLSFEESALSSVKSNYRIYQKESVRTYLDVRNQLSEMLINLQEKVFNINDDYQQGFQKNILALLTFILSVIIMQVVSDNDFTGTFGWSIAIIAYSCLAISYRFFRECEKENEQRISSFEHQHNQLRERYSPMLSDEDIQDIFVHSNPDKFSKMRINSKRISRLWKYSIILLVIAFTLLAIIDTFSLFYDFPFCDTIKIFMKYELNHLTIICRLCPLHLIQELSLV